MSPRTPQTERDDAWHVALHPADYTENVQSALFERGYQEWQSDDGQTDADALTDKIEDFTLTALEQPPRDRVLDDPHVTDPGVLAVVATLGAISIKYHPELQELTDHYYDPDLTLHHRVRDLWVDHIFWMLTTHPDRAGFQQRIAETGYAREQEDKFGPPPGRVCTGIQRMPEFGNHVYVEIPVEHASRKLLVRDENDELAIEIQDGNVYVPGWHLDEMIEEVAADAWERLVRAQETGLADEERRWVLDNTPRIHERIDEYLDANRLDELVDENGIPIKVRIIVNAIATADDPGVDFNTWLTADEIYAAVEESYVSEHLFSVKQSIAGPRSVSNILKEHEEKYYIEIDEGGRVNEFQLAKPYGNARDVTVEEPEDILELPCMANMDEYLQQQKPTRWILYSLARLLMSLENDFSVDELVDFWSRWPWFDKQETRYQLEYEKNRTMPDGRVPMPIGCDNDNRHFSEFCIGKENCPYRIYGSLDFTDEVMNQLDDYHD